MSTREDSNEVASGGSELNVELDIFQDLYDSEINFAISTFWDGGYTARLGDEMNGFNDKSDCLDNMQEVARELTRMAILHYPRSGFANKYKYI